MLRRVDIKRGCDVRWRHHLAWIEQLKSKIWTHVAHAKLWSIRSFAALLISIQVHNECVQGSIPYGKDTSLRMHLWVCPCADAELVIQEPFPIAKKDLFSTS